MSGGAASGLGKKVAGKAVKHAKKQILLWLAPYLLPVLLVVAIVVAGVVLLSSTSAAPTAQAEAVTLKEAARFGLNEADLVAIRAAANASRVPWQVLVSLAAAESGQTPAAADVGVSVPMSSPPPGSSPAVSPSPTVASLVGATPSPSAAAPAATPGGPYRINPGSGLSQADSRDLYASSMFLAERLAKNLDGKPGFIGVNSLTNNAVVHPDGLYLDPTSADYKARENSFVKALVKLPVANNNDPYMTQVYETAQAWALGRPGSQCGSGGLSVTGIAGAESPGAASPPRCPSRCAPRSSWPPKPPGYRPPRWPRCI